MKKIIIYLEYLLKGIVYILVILAIVSIIMRRNLFVGTNITSILISAFSILSGYISLRIYKLYDIKKNRAVISAIIFLGILGMSTSFLEVVYQKNLLKEEKVNLELLTQKKFIEYSPDTIKKWENACIEGETFKVRLESARAIYSSTGRKVVYLDQEGKKIQYAPSEEETLKEREIELALSQITGKIKVNNKLFKVTVITCLAILLVMFLTELLLRKLSKGA